MDTMIIPIYDEEEFISLLDPAVSDAMNEIDDLWELLCERWVERFITGSAAPIADRRTRMSWWWNFRATGDTWARCTPDCKPRAAKPLC